MNNKLRKVIMAIAAVVFIVSAAQLIGIFLSYKEGTDQYDEIAQLVIQTAEETSPALEPENTDESAETEAEPEPDGGDPTAAAITGVDFDQLKSINSDALGWIYVPGTMVSYPIVQTDNNEYYLNHTIYGDKNNAGSIFLEYLIEDGLDGKNPIIYGHNMLNGSMFGTLKRYKNESFYREHPTLFLFTPEGNYTYEIFAAYTVKGASSDAYTYGFGSEDSFMAYITKVKGYAEYDTGVEILPSDKIITLSTCTNRGADRYVVQARRAD